VLLIFSALGGGWGGWGGTGQCGKKTLLHCPSLVPFQGPKNSRFSGPPLIMALVMDLPGSKTFHTGPYQSWCRNSYYADDHTPRNYTVLIIVRNRQCNLDDLQYIKITCGVTSLKNVVMN